MSELLLHASEYLLSVAEFTNSTFVMQIHVRQSWSCCVSMIWLDTVLSCQSSYAIPMETQFVDPFLVWRRSHHQEVHFQVG
jgi:hypothetical protein